ncbi:hypothetical protein [Cystobacter fuscus]|uniref:hypothetical protein n=1 Tax=Cystobacter fuscus TaxID=43 RepID=UPI002B27F1BE|nr:hypothetical protein F0U63_13015 [Cystobacter fuscus]
MNSIPLVEPQFRPGEGSNHDARRASDVINIIVLVAGTVDPLNMDSSTRAASYSRSGLAQDTNWYWSDDTQLIQDLERLRESHKNLHVFTEHGWSGANAVDNRKVAGAYLADRLAGQGGESAYYQGFLKREVNFHLIGHSHGGNVINELTQRAAEVWPKNWRIRSISYLSTPFFKKKHQVRTEAFHPDCKILNVINQYDLTQRVIADFSLLNLHGLTERAEFVDFKQRADTIHFDVSRLAALGTVRPRSVGKNWYDVNPLVMEPRSAALLYDECIRFLDDLQRATPSLRGLVGLLNRELDFPVAKGLGACRRKVLSDGLTARFQAGIDKLEGSLTRTLSALRARRKSNAYPLVGFFRDLAGSQQSLLGVLANLLWVDRQSLMGPLLELICDSLVEQIDSFECASESPAAQLRGSAYASSLEQLDVTRHDEYSRMNGDAAVRSLFKRLEEAQERYAQSSQKKELVDILLTLLTQVEFLRKASGSNYLKYIQWGLACLSGVDKAWSFVTRQPVSELLQVSGRFMEVMSTYRLLCNERNFGPLERKRQHVSRVNYGSLSYFMRVSHSVSRQAIPEWVSKLKEQLDTRSQLRREM